MQDKILDAFNEQTRLFFEPVRKFNSLMLENMEKLTQYQMESMKRYSQLGSERLRDASEVNDADDLRDFGTRQVEMINALSRQMLEDAQALSELSLQFKAELEQLFAEAGLQAVSQAQQATTGEPPADKDKPPVGKAPAKASSQSSRSKS